MPNWNGVLQEIAEVARTTPGINPVDLVRRKYLAQIHTISGRNVIAYYSGWLQKARSVDVAINDKDKSAFMLAIHGLNRKLGLDLILHTPGGDLAATESLVDYLSSMFGKDIRVIVPQISMSAGTMMALSAKEIVMGKHSNLGPIDPQMGGVACHGILMEFDNAVKEIKANPHSAALWQVIIGKYHPTLLGACRQAIDWSEKIVKEWLANNMFEGDEQCTTKVDKVIKLFADHSHQKSHARHISKRECKEIGLCISDLEDNPQLQEAVLTTHHAFMHTFSITSAIKIVENHMGVAYVENIQLPHSESRTTPRSSQEEPLPTASSF